MPSFDVVSEVDLQEVRNATDQANREVGTRFDFKGSDASFSLDDAVVNLQAKSEFQLEQMMDILQKKLVKRSVDIGCMDIAKPETANNRARQAVTIRQGIDIGYRAQDRKGHQGRKAQGPGADTGRPGACQWQEA